MLRDYCGTFYKHPATFIFTSYLCKILNSGRLLFNSISDSIIFSSHKSIVAEARLDAALKSQTRNVNIIAEKGIVRVGTERADQSAVKGDDFNIQFDALLVQLKLLCKALENEPALSIAKAQASCILCLLCIAGLLTFTLKEIFFPSNSIFSTNPKVTISLFKSGSITVLNAVNTSSLVIISRK